MNNINEQPLKTIKNYLLAREQPTNELKEKQMELISILTYDISLDTSTVENYNQNIFKHKYFIRKCHNLIDLIPVKQFRDEWTNIINNYNFGNETNLLMNIGERVTLNTDNKIVFEEWRNVIDSKDDNKVIFSIHKTFIYKLYSIKITGKDFCYILEIGFDGVKLDRNILINREVHRVDEDDNLSDFTSDTEAESILSDELNNSDNEINTNNRFGGNNFMNNNNIMNNNIMNINNNIMNNNNLINNNKHHSNSISLFPSSAPPKEFLFNEDDEFTFDESNFLMSIPDEDMNYPFNNQNNNQNNNNNNNNINNINNLRRRHHRRHRPNKVIDVTDFEDEDLNQCSGSIRYTKYNGQVKSSYNSVISKGNDRITSEATFENEAEKIKETQKEEVTYQIDKKKLKERMRNRIPINDNEINTNSNNNQIENDDTEEEIPIIVSQVDTETTKIDERNDYYETNFETYHINNRIKWGKKRYQNNRNRRYQEDWKKEKLENGIQEEKYQKFLDDGCGKKTTEKYGKKQKENNNEIIFEYHDTNIYDVSNGDETTIKIGKDKNNEWNQRNYRNRIRNFSHVENYGRNNNMEWTEKWDEEPNGEKYCKKWGKSEFEEWEEEWKESYDGINDNREKICVKKCKKLLEDKEWMETWTEKNSGKPNSEKTCYKMNKTNGYLFENYWGNIIVDHHDGKRKKYVGYNRNGDRKDYVDYTYENDNN